MTDRLSQLDLSIFEQIRQTDEYGNEFWGARQLAKVLEYTDFRNFQSVINKAKEACKNSNQLIENHLVDFNEMVRIGSGAVRQMESVKLSRYACYLIVQNADPSKEVVALKTCQLQIVLRHWKRKMKNNNLKKDKLIFNLEI